MKNRNIDDLIKKGEELENQPMIDEVEDDITNICEAVE
jgi:hypothetical protein